jgi:pilus assembly protein CpaB
MTKISNKKLVFIAILLSLLTVTLVYCYLKNLTDATVVLPGVPVIVAKVDIPPKTKITLDMVNEVKVPSEYIQPGAVTSLDKVVGIMAKGQILTGEQINERYLLRENKSAGFTGIIPRDKRAVTVAVNEVTGVAGFVKAGDYVDVIVSFDVATVGDNVSQLVLQDILVLAANRDTEISTGDITGAKDVNKAGTVTLAVTPDDAAKLALADEKGKIRLILQPYLPLSSTVLTVAVTPTDLVGVHTSPLKNEPAPPAPPAPVQAMPSQPSPPPAPSVQDQPSTKTKSVAGIMVIRGTKIDN